jgi:hypothetical protein
MIMIITCLETVQDDILSMANFLVHQKGLDIGSLVSRKLNHITDFQILLNGTVTTEILLEGLANSLRIEILCNASYGRNTFSSISLLDTDVNLFLRGSSSVFVSGVLKGV